MREVKKIVEKNSLTPQNIPNNARTNTQMEYMRREDRAKQNNIFC